MARPQRQMDVSVATATEQDMDAIFRLRHEVYASELGQHPENSESRLSDSLDSFNSYIVARVGGRMAGFVSLTPPGGASYSVDKYFSRDDVPVPFDGSLYELRILTVAREFRGSFAALALMYAALRWIESHGGRNVVAVGRVELLDLYLKAGMEPVGKRVRSGALTFELLTGSVSSARDRLRRSVDMERRIEERLDWQLDIPLQEQEPCYHGGAFFDAIGREFDNLERIGGVINADVLDAWFPPSPRVTDTLREHLPWSIGTSPPTGSEGLIAQVARCRGVGQESVLPGAGSSSLIFLALRHWLTSSSRALILDPAYGEYAHVLENVVRCGVDRFVLSRGDGYRVDLGRLGEALTKGYDLAVIVNPNNPTGRHVPRRDMEEMLLSVPAGTIVWIDETYVDYVDGSESLERFASRSRNVVVCKSMSKAYALSGLRAGYLCGPRGIIEPLRLLTPPWAVSLPGQMAAVMALQDPGYYSEQYRETHSLRSQLADDLSALGDLEIVPGVANYLLFHIPSEGPDAESVLAQCRKHDLFLRDASATAPGLGSRALRIAVKDAATNGRMVEILGHALNGTSAAGG